MSMTTRTLNPLPFEHLEPRRFEDMVRQIAYDFRPWRSIEPLGRMGADEGIDIRAIEGEAVSTTNVEDGEGLPDQSPGRLWIVQCKREKKVEPRDIHKIVAVALDGLAEPPYGFVLAAACDFSKRTRDVLRNELFASGVREIHAWGKADLEDMLFLPKNDRLLFIYFGISLQARRMSMRAEWRSQVAMKKTLDTVLKGFPRPSVNQVFLRDPSAAGYPRTDLLPDFDQNPRWGYWTCLFHEPPHYLAFKGVVFRAYMNLEDGTWDAAMACKEIGMQPARHLPPVISDERRAKVEAANTYWSSSIPGQYQAELTCIYYINYNRIIAVDELGDGINPGPHLLVEFDKECGPFESNLWWPRLDWPFGLTAQRVEMDDGNRVEIFPPELRIEDD